MAGGPATAQAGGENQQPVNRSDAVSIARFKLFQREKFVDDDLFAGIGHKVAQRTQSGFTVEIMAYRPRFQPF
ncbi:hypothetical protein [Klebsiella quasipneumoniae]|uniref:hypothetical protein n=1 Tax=Klebsiella quasipneumoniae TaxID=1463165 RepID=UPI001D0DB612|nr:hypothetical protein [Klebsiella quasipneumoniae]